MNNMITDNNTQFGKWRSLFWPVYPNEVKKIVPLLIILFFLGFNQCALWNMKDSLIVTTAGAEIIPFIKVWAIMPCTFLATFIFAKLSNSYSQERVFHLIICAFLLFFGVFAFLVYPLRDLLHPLVSAAYLDQLLPPGFKGLISMYRYWTFTAFYVFCELWNTMVVYVLFWGFANAITQFSEASRFYSILGIVYNIATICAGLLAGAMMRIGNEWEISMMLLILVIIASGLIAMFTHRWMHCNLTKRDIFIASDREDIGEKKHHYSLQDSFRLIFRSKYLICIAIIVLAYNLVLNVVEVVWKDQLKLHYPSTVGYNQFLSNLQIIQGIVALVLSLTLAEMMRLLGWTRIALITPLLMLISSLFFFEMLLYPSSFTDYFMYAQIAPSSLVVIFGAIQNCVSKACKFSLFDATKEMAFIPLSSEHKLKGKIAIDGLGIRLGKSSGSVLLQCLLIIFSTISACWPYVGAIAVIAMIFWISSVLTLSRAKELNPVYAPE